jgi:hypothetical protein
LKRAALAVVALLAGSGAALAATSDKPEIGEAELVVSAVRGRLGQLTRELAIKDNVYSEEAIETGADAAARLVFLDGSELSMGPSSRMVLDRYVYDPDTGVGEMVMQMVTGVFEFASGDIPSADYDLGTPFGNLAIRGTRCVVDVAAGSRMVVRCSELDEVSVAGKTLTSGSDCLLVPLPGTGEPVFLGGNACDLELTQAISMLALLGRLALEPAAGVLPIGGIPQGPGGDDDPPGFSGGGGVSPQ